MDIAYVNYKDKVEISFDGLIVILWNKYIEDEENENKIFVNDKDFFSNTFENAYDAACAVSLSGKYTWSDDYVYFDDGGNLTSFSHWDDERSPIDPDRIDISHLIDGLKKWKKDMSQDDMSYQEGSIATAIQDALKEV